jgi:hypothetical protein
MDVDPVEAAQEEKQEARRHDSALGNAVAVTVALLATFMGICKVKDDNVVQAMQQAQADKVDHWAFYQARNLREEVARATATQLRLSLIGVREPEKVAAVQAEIASYQRLVADQAEKKDALRVQALADQATYDALNYRDDQFDLCDALLAVAISMLAVSTLTGKRWLFGLAMVPTAFGLAMGLAGLLGWHLHSETLARWLS